MNSPKYFSSLLWIMIFVELNSCTVVDPSANSSTSPIQVANIHNDWDARIMPKYNELSTQQIPQFMKLAEQGNREAAVRLSDHFFFVKHDGDLGAKWREMAAKLGDPGCQQGFALALWYRRGLAAKTEVIYWLEKAAAGGNKSALDDLKEIRAATTDQQHEG